MRGDKRLLVSEERRSKSTPPQTQTPPPSLPAPMAAAPIVQGPVPQRGSSPTDPDDQGFVDRMRGGNLFDILDDTQPHPVPLQSAEFLAEANPPASSATFTCSVCTYVNHVDRGVCEICGTKSPLAQRVPPSSPSNHLPSLAATDNQQQSNRPSQAMNRNIGASRLQLELSNQPNPHT